MAIGDENDLQLRVTADTSQATPDLAKLVQAQQGVAKTALDAARGISSLASTFKAELLNSLGSSSGILKSVVESLGGLSTTTKIAGVGVAALAGAFVLLRREMGDVSAFTAHAQAIKVSSETMGVSSKFAQALSKDLQASGQNASLASYAMRIFSMHLSQAAGGVGNAADIFARFKIPLKDIEGQTRSTDVVLSDFAKALLTVESQSERSRLATELLGIRGASVLLPRINELAQGVNAYTARLVELGVVLSDATIKIGTDYNTAITRAQQATEAHKMVTAAATTEALLPFARAWQTITEAMARGSQHHYEAIATIIKLATSLAAVVVPLVTITGLIKILAIVGPTLVSAFAGLGTIVAAMAAFLGTGPGLIVVLAALGIAAATAGTYWLLYGRSARQAGEDTQYAAEKAAGAVEATNKAAKSLTEAINIVNTALASSDAAAARRSGDQSRAIKIERDAALGELKKSYETEKKILERQNQDTAALTQKYEADVIKTKLDFDTKNLDLTKTQSDALTTTTIEGTRKRQEQQLELEKAGWVALRNLHQISILDEFDLDTAAGKRKLELQIEADQRELAEKSHTVEERAKLNATIAADEKSVTVYLAQRSAERIKVEQDEIDKKRNLLDKVAVLQEQAFGSPQEQRIAALQRAQGEMLKQYRDMPDAITAINIAYTKMIADAHAGTIDLRDTLSTALEDAFSGKILGTKGGGFSAWFSGFSDSIKKTFAKGFADALIEKAGFDTKMHLNFTETLPASATEGASSIGKIFSGLFSLLSGGSGIGQGVSESGGVMSWVGGGIKSLGSSLGGLFGLGGGAGAGVNISDTVGGIGLGLPTLTMRGGAGALGGLAGMLPMVGAGIGVASLISSASGMKSMTEPGEAAWNWLGGLFGHGSIFSAGPTQEHVNMDSVRDWMNKSGVTKSQGTIGGRSAWGDHSIIDRVFPGVTDVPLGPGNQLGWGGLGIMMSGLGNDKGQAGMAINAFANNEQLLGRTTEQVKQDLLKFAKAAGIDMVTAMDDLTESFRQGKIAADEYDNGVVGLVSIFNDLPKAIEPGLLTFKSLSLVEGKWIVDQDKLKSVLQSVTDATNLARNALRSYWDAMYADPTQSAKQRDQQQQERIAYEIRVKNLQNSIQLARDFGDEASAATLQMQLSAEQAARGAQIAAQKVLSPGEQFLKSIRDGLRKAITDGIVGSLVESGLIQVALAPFFDALKSLFKVMADPASTADQYAAAMAIISDSMNTVGSTINYLLPTYEKLANLIGPWMEWLQGGMPGSAPIIKPMATGGLVTHPTLALLGESGPELVMPLSRTSSVASGAIVVNVNLSGPFVGGDQSSFDRLGRIAGESTLRTLKQNNLLG